MSLRPRSFPLGLSLLLLAQPLCAAQDPDEPVRDGPWLYTRNCAGCHNENGDGRGVTILQLGLTARDFKQGGFAFGDTREQMFRTVSTGIPGRSPMPSFKGILSDDEIRLVVEHVRTLMPPREDEAPKNTELVVHDRPVIARGKLPPIVDGAKEVPRGLLIGTPEGMTFEYDLDGVKLLGVRLGAFADREDWHDRGGGYLRPLGEPVFLFPEGTDSFFIDQATALSNRPLRVLRSTFAQHGRVGCVFELQRGGARGALIEERLHVEATSVGPAFTREWHVELAQSARLVNLSYAMYRIEPMWTMTPLPDGSACWLVCDVGDGVFECVVDRSSKVGHGQCRPIDVGCASVGLTRSDPQARVTYLRVRNWTPEVGLHLAKELGP